MAQESFEDTQRRLGLTPVAASPSEVRVGGPTPTPSRSRAGRVVAIVAGLAVLGAGAFAASQFLPAAGIGSDEWTTYPGTWFEEDEHVLAANSLEATAAEGELLLAELTESLQPYGFEWTVFRDGEVSVADNGYNGDSMLKGYESATLVGAVQLDDPGARADIVEIFTAIMSGPGSTIVVDNDSITDDDAEYFFGSSDREEQAEWTAWSYGEHFTDLAADLAVYDSTVATGSEFHPVYWLPEDSDGTLFVSISVYADYLLSESDRDAFIAALEPYEGKTRPDYRG